MKKKLDTHPLVGLIIGVFLIYAAYMLIGSGVNLAQSAVTAFSPQAEENVANSVWETPCSAPLPLMMRTTGGRTSNLPTIEGELVAYPTIPITASAIPSVTLLAKWGAGESGRYVWGEGNQPFTDMVLLSNSNRVALATDEGVQLRHLNDGIIGCQTSRDLMASELAVTRDQTQIAANHVKEGGTVQIWGIDDGIIRHDFTLDHNIGDMRFTPNGEELLAFATFGRGTSTPLTTALPNAPILWREMEEARTTLFHPDAQGNVLLAAIIGRETVTLRNGEGKQPQTFTPEFGNMMGTFSADGTRLALAGNEGMGVWDIEEGRLLWAVRRTNTHINDVLFSPNGEWMATVSNGNGIIWIWDAQNGNLLGSLEGHLESVVALEIAPDGTYLLSASQDGTIGVWGIP